MLILSIVCVLVFLFSDALFSLSGGGSGLVVVVCPLFDFLDLLSNTHTFHHCLFIRSSLSSSFSFPSSALFSLLLISLLRPVNQRRREQQQMNQLVEVFSWLLLPPFLNFKLSRSSFAHSHTHTGQYCLLVIDWC